MTTHNQYHSPVVKGQEILTTHTDYVNKYQSVLQTTCYNFTGSDTTPELCAGVVKAQPLFLKNPAQHAADLKLLQEKDDLKLAFLHPSTGMSKSIDCIRVDGAGDEGPLHEEVQFFWSERHLKEKKLVTLVTTRSSGASYLNRVELQNGCLIRAHSNLFIPSTLHGSCVKESGQVDKSILHQNLSTAIDVYIQRCNHCPCGETVINLYRGAESDQDARELLLIFLKGSKKKKAELKKSHQELYSHFERVWDVRTRHMVRGLPNQYVFFLRCCYDKSCPHPLCQSGQPEKQPTWFPGGPPISFFPLPIPDLSRPWGSSDCDTCSGFCSGHYLVPDLKLHNIKQSIARASIHPPSTIIKTKLAEIGDDLTGPAVSELAKSVLLTESDVHLWLDHLRNVQKNRKIGAMKAAATRKAKKKKQNSASECTLVQPQVDDQIYCEDSCALCGKPWEEETTEVEMWIQCELCKMWYHWDCASIDTEPEVFHCKSCL